MTIIIINKKWFISTISTILAIIFAGTLISLYRGLSITTINIPSTTKVIVIDPGHGGVDPGAVGRENVLEKDINLSIGLYLREYLEQSGSIVVMTRETDTGLYDFNKNIKNKKNQDLKRRKTIVKESRGDIFITIHLNSFSQQQYYGAQTFYPKNNVVSKRLAEKVQEELINVLDKENKRVALVKSDMYLIKDLEIPSILVECGFLSNPQELSKLKNPEYQKKISWALYVGIQKFLNEN